MREESNANKMIEIKFQFKMINECTAVLQKMIFVIVNFTVWHSANIKKERQRKKDIPIGMFEDDGGDLLKYNTLF